MDDEFAWDMAKAFVEIETKPGDPVGKPLAAEWNDDPTIPPAYNAKCIKTAFYDPDNQEAFLASVRDTKYWPTLQRDPVFRYRRGMVVVQFPGSHHEYFTYHCSRKIDQAWFKERDIIPTPSDAALIDAPKAAARIHRPSPRDESPFSHGKRSYRDTGGLDDYRDAKRARWSPLNGNGARDRSPPPPHHRRGADSPFSHRPPSASTDSPARWQNGDRDRLAPPYSSSSSSMARRNDSGYHSSYREDKAGPQRHLLPSPSIREREYSRPRSASYSRNGGGSRSRTRSPPPRRSRSRSRSRTPARRSRSPIVESDSESGMSDLDYALLGMARPEKKKAKKNTVKPVAKKPRVKVNDAFR